jgi:hypothetical protein
MPGLSAFQDAFTEALGGDEAALADWVEPGRGAGLSVYRNTVAKGLADALAAAFPTVQRLVGEDWFAAAAVAFARERPPAEPSLLAYGGDFADWLETFEPAAALPYLPGVARLDRLWLQAHLAADAELLDAAAFAALDEQGLEATAVVLHPSVGFAWFADNIVSLWRANRPPASPPESFTLEACGEGVLIARPFGEVVVVALDPGAYAFVAACAAGRTLAVAARAVQADPCADLAGIVGACIASGVFTGLTKTETRP